MKFCSRNFRFFVALIFYGIGISLFSFFNLPLAFSNNKLRHRSHVNLELPIPSFELAIAASGENKLFFIMTKGWASLDTRKELFLDALFLTNPSLNVFFVSTTLEPAPLLFHQYIERGYFIRGVRLNCNSLCASRWWVYDTNRNWVCQSCQNSSVKYFYTHLTDLLRFTLLFRHGGIYSDTDAIFLKKIPAIEFVGLDKGTNPSIDGNISIPWFLFPNSSLYAAPGVVHLFKGSDVARRALTAFDLKSYNPACFNCVGPKALNFAIMDAISKHAETPLAFPFHHFYPVPYYEARQLFDNTSITSPLLWILASQKISTSVHLFGGMTHSVAIENNSVVSSMSQFYSHKSRDSICSFGGVGIIIMSRRFTDFTGNNLVFLRDCFFLLDGIILSLYADSGHFEIENANYIGAFKSKALHSVAAANVLLSQVSYFIDPLSTSSTISIRVVVCPANSPLPLAQKLLALAVFSRLVTVISHSSGRLQHVSAMYNSIQRFFPGTPLLASDDTVQSPRAGLGPGMKWIVVPPDCGLSFARNTMISLAATPFVQLLDDDFVLNEHSHLDILLGVLLSSKFDLASAIIPADIANFVQFRGFISVSTEKDLLLEPGSYGMVGGCLQVDFVPNVFMASTQALKRVQWDDSLKLGEHEDFFLRAKSAGLRVLSCDTVKVVHNQERWWNTDFVSKAYAKKRTRVYDFFQIALRKHGLRRLISFGTVQSENSDFKNPSQENSILFSQALQLKTLSFKHHLSKSLSLSKNFEFRVLSDVTCCGFHAPWPCFSGLHDVSNNVIPAMVQVAFVTYATGPYNQFVIDLWTSIQKFAFPNEVVHLFIFTDQPSRPEYVSPKIHTRLQERLGWPFDSLGRHFLYLNHISWFQAMDYVFSIDSDALIVDTLSSQMLSERVLTLHAWSFGMGVDEFTYDKRVTLLNTPFSSGYIGPGEGKCYFAGGFFGGSLRGFTEILTRTVAMARADLSAMPPRVALWHDESYLNRVAVSFPPTLVLGPNFMYPEPPIDQWLYSSDNFFSGVWKNPQTALPRFVPKILNLGVRKHTKNELALFQPESIRVPDLMSPSSPITVPFPASQSRLLASVTILIKAFERPSCLHRLLHSIGRTCPGIAVIIFDDSARELISPNEISLYNAAYGLNLSYIRSVYDVGLSEGRNLLIQAAQTPYVLLLDDDFILDVNSKDEDAFPPKVNFIYAHTQEISSLAYLVTVLDNSRFDIVGGCIDSTQGAAWSYNLVRNGSTLQQTLDVSCSLHDGNFRSPDFSTPTVACWKSDSILNFFMAKTSAIKTNLWDPRLKVGEHEDFFLRAKESSLQVAICRGVSAHNDNTCDATPAYKMLRRRVFDYWVIFFQKHGFTRMQTLAGVYLLNCVNASLCIIDVRQDQIWFG